MGPVGGSRTVASRGDHRRMSQRPRARIRYTALVAIVAALVVGGLPTAVAAASTDPDKDGLPSKWERDWSKTSPTRKDTDRDGIKDGSEDPDKDTLTNRMEYLAGMRPRRGDSDRDGIRDDKEDTDRDGLRTRFEFYSGTRPKLKDTDGDGLRDDRENPDKDGLTNRTEQTRGTHPREWDTDDDGYSDGAEVAAGTNPLDKSSHPTLPTTPPPPGGGSGGAPTLPGIPDCSIFPVDNVWNVRIDDREVAVELGDDDLGHRADAGPAHGLRFVLGLRHPHTTSSPRHAGIDADLRLRRRLRPRRYPIPASPKTEGGGPDRRPPHPHGRQGRLSALRAIQRAQGRWRMVGRQWRDVGPAIERPADGRLDQRRCGGSADPAGPRPLRRGESPGRSTTPSGSRPTRRARRTSIPRGTTPATTRRRLAADGTARPPGSLRMTSRASRRRPG